MTPADLEALRWEVRNGTASLHALQRAFNDQSQRLQLALAEVERLQAEIERLAFSLNKEEAWRIRLQNERDVYLTELERLRSQARDT